MKREAVLSLIEPAAAFETGSSCHTTWGGSIDIPFVFKGSHINGGKSTECLVLLVVTTLSKEKPILSESCRFVHFPQNVCKKIK